MSNSKKRKTRNESDKQYEVIEGVGINVRNIEPFIDRKKYIKALLDYFPGDAVLIELGEGSYDAVCDNPYFGLEQGLVYISYGKYGSECGFPFACAIERTDRTVPCTCTCDATTNGYFYYRGSILQCPPFKTPEEIHKAMVEIVQSVTTGLTGSQIDAMIDDCMHIEADIDYDFVC